MDKNKINSKKNIKTKKLAQNFSQNYENSNEKPLKNGKKSKNLYISAKTPDFETDFDSMSVLKNMGFDSSVLIDDYDGLKNSQKNKNKQEKLYKKLKQRELAALIEDNPFSKKVISMRKNLAHKSSEQEKNNSKRIKRCAKLLIDMLDYEDREFEIFRTINFFNTNGKKTIVYFIDSFYPVIDGVVSVLDNYATILKDKFNIVVCAPEHKQSEQKFDRYFVLYSTSLYIKKQGYDLGFPQLDTEFQQYLSLLKIDLIHVQSPFNMGSFGVSLAKRRKIPCFATFHSQLKKNFYNAVKNEAIASWLTKVTMNIYKQADVVLTMNAFTKSLIADYGLKRNVEILPNATNLIPQKFDFSKEQAVLGKYGLDDRSFNIIFIGRFVEVKNVYFILKIIENLLIINKKFKMIFLGYGPEQSKMSKFVKDKGLSQHVVFTGKVESVEEKSILIKNSNLLLFPSDYDTDGIVKIECACYSVPTLCIQNTGVASNITDNHNGFVEQYSLDAFVSRLNKLINNPKLVSAVGKNAHKDLYITWQDVCDRLSALYEEHIKNYHINKAKPAKAKNPEKQKLKNIRLNNSRKK